MVWPTMVVILHVPTEAKSYGYCWGQVVDLGPMMPAAQFGITEERWNYLCTMRALVFEGSILTYNPALNEAEWVPMCGLANNLSWAEERSVVALANYVPCALGELERKASLRVGRVMSCLGDDSSMTSMEGEESWFLDAPIPCHIWIQTMRREESKEPVGSKEGTNGWMSPGEEAEANLHTDQCQCSQNWESVMEESEGLAYDDPHSISDATIMGVDSPPVPPLSSHDESGNSSPTTLRGLALRSLRLPMEQMLLLVPTVTTLDFGTDTVEVHIPQLELDNL